MQRVVAWDFIILSSQKIATNETGIGSMVDVSENCMIAYHQATVAEFIAIVYYAYISRGTILCRIALSKNLYKKALKPKMRHDKNHRIACHISKNIIIKIMQTILPIYKMVHKIEQVVTINGILVLFFS